MQSNPPLVIYRHILTQLQANYRSGLFTKDTGMELVHQRQSTAMVGARFDFRVLV